MTYTGTVEGGMVKLPPEAALPDGTKVRIEPLPLETSRTFASNEELLDKTCRNRILTDLADSEGW
jgi:hypothetical protein